MMLESVGPPLVTQSRQNEVGPCTSQYLEILALYKRIGLGDVGNRCIAGPSRLDSGCNQFGRPVTLEGSDIDPCPIEIVQIVGAINFATGPRMGLHDSSPYPSR